VPVEDIRDENACLSMKKLLLTGVAALLLATGTGHAALRARVPVRGRLRAALSHRAVLIAATLLATGAITAVAGGVV
jgi:hypothetical protein